MLAPPPSREIRTRFLYILRHMFGKADDSFRLAPTAYDRYFDRRFGITKRFSDGDSVFLDHPKQEPKIAQERANTLASRSSFPNPSVFFELFARTPTSSSSNKTVLSSTQVSYLSPLTVALSALPRT